MKKVFVLVMALSIVSVAMSGTESDSKSTPGVAVINEGSTFKLFYKSLQVSDVTVTIYNSNKEIVFVENFKKSDGFIRPYNFEKLVEGKYTIELKDKDGTHKKSILYQDASPVKAARIVKMKGEEKYALLVPNKGEELIYIGISNRDGKEIYSSREMMSGDFARMFDLKGLNGSFTITLVDSEGKMKSIVR